MDNIISELVRIETVAKETLASIESSRKSLPRRIYDACEVIQAEMDEEYKARLTELRDKCFTEAEEAVSQIRIRAQSQFSSLEDEYYKNHEEIERELFRNIIKEG